MKRFGLHAALMMVLLAVTMAAGRTAQAEPAGEKDHKTGIVLGVEDGTIRISLGKEEGIKKGFIFGVYSLTRVVKLPLAGEVSLKKEREIGKIEVTRTTAHDAEAQVVILEEGQKLSRGMTVIQLIEKIEENKAPEIVSVIPEVEEIEGGKGIPLEIKVIDREGDTFEMLWKADKGQMSLERTSRMINKWTAPREKCEAVISVEAVDKWGNTSTRQLKLKSRGTGKGGRVALAPFRSLGKAPISAGNLAYNEIAFDVKGDMFVNDQGKDGIFRHLLDMQDKGIKISAYKNEDEDELLDAPHCFDVAGNKLFVCDGYDSFIRVFSTGGKFIQSIGSGSGSTIGLLSAPIDMAVAPDGSLYLIDSGNRCIEVLSGAGRSRFRAGKYGTAKGELQTGAAIEVGPEGTVYVLDKGRNAVLLFTSDMKFISEFQVETSDDSELTDLELDASRKRLYILDSGEERVAMYSSGGKPLQLIDTDKDAWQHVSEPTAIAVNPIGQLYIGSAENGQLARYNADGSFAGKQDTAHYRNIGAVCANGRRIFMMERSNYQIMVLDYEGWCLAKIGGNSSKDGNIGEGTRLAASEKFVYVLDTDYHNVHKYTFDGKLVASIGDKGEGLGKFSEAIDIAVDAADNLFVLDEDLLRVTIFTGEGKFESAFQSEANSAIQMKRPTRLTVSRDGQAIYIYDYSQYSLLKYNRKGIGQSSYGSKGSKDLGTFYNVDDIGLDEAGFVVVSEPRYNRVQKVDFTGAGGRGYVQFAKDTMLLKGGTFYAVDPYGQIIVYSSTGKLTLLR